jgi:hypothetical protein
MNISYLAISPKIAKVVKLAAGINASQYGQAPIGRLLMTAL